MDTILTALETASWPALCIATIGASPRLRISFSSLETSGHSIAARINAGVTGFSWAILASVFCIAERNNGRASSSSPRQLALSGNRASKRPNSRSLSKVAAAYPDKNSFRNSSNKRAEGILPSR